MRLCVVVTNTLRKDPRVVKQIEIAKQNGITVSFVGVMDANYSKDFLDQSGTEWTLIERKKKYEGVNRSVYVRLARIFDESKQLTRAIIATNPDVIHANDFDTLPEAYKAAKKCGAGLVYDSHEIFAENAGIANRRLYKKFVVAKENKLVHRVDRMISVSHAAAAYFRDKYHITEPTVITNCPMKSKYPLREKNPGFELISQGMYYDGRGYEEFITAGKYADPGISFVLRGYGATEDKLKKLISDENVGDRVHMVPPVEVAELIAAASASHVGAVLTRPINVNFDLSVSNKVFEFVHAGLPVILSDLPEHRYLNEKFHFGMIIDEVTPKAIAEAANQLFRDPARYQTLSENAKKMAEEMCWERESLRLLEIYREAAKK